jgi:hypothetical protein
MAAVPPPAFSSTRTTHQFCADTCVLIGRSDPDHFVADELPALRELLELYDDRGVMLAKTDNVDTERTHRQPAAR